MIAFIASQWPGLLIGLFAGASIGAVIMGIICGSDDIGDADLTGGGNPCNSAE